MRAVSRDVTYKTLKDAVENIFRDSYEAVLHKKGV